MALEACHALPHARCSLWMTPAKTVVVSSAFLSPSMCPTSKQALCQSSFNAIVVARGKNEAASGDVLVDSMQGEVTESLGVNGIGGAIHEGDVADVATVSSVADGSGVISGGGKKKGGKQKKKKSSSLLVLSDSDTEEVWQSQHVPHHGAHPAVTPKGAGSGSESNGKANGAVAEPIGAIGGTSPDLTDGKSEKKQGLLTLSINGNESDIDVNKISHYPEHGGGGSLSTDSTDKNGKKKKKKKVYDFEAELDRLQVRSNCRYTNVMLVRSSEQTRIPNVPKSLKIRASEEILGHCMDFHPKLVS